MSQTHPNQLQENPINLSFQPVNVMPGDVVVGGRASLIHRLLASIIDGLIICPVAAIVWVPIAWSGLIPTLLLPLAVSAIAFGIFAAINFKLLMNQGQTVGKRLMKLQIVNSDGEVPDVQDVLTKRYAVFWLANAIPFVGPVASLVNVLLVFRSSGLAGHDEIAGTKVVYATSA